MRPPIWTGDLDRTFVMNLWAYSKAKLIDWRVVRWSIGFGVPATVVGALLTRWVSGSILVKTTDLVLIALGVRLLLAKPAPDVKDDGLPSNSTMLLAMVAVIVGLASGLLANSGGFLLAPLYFSVLRLPIKAAFANSLAVASVLAIPGTVVHAALGHVDWTIVGVFGSTSVPLSFLGARVALRTDAHRLEKIYAMALIVLGAVFLLIR